MPHLLGVPFIFLTAHGSRQDVIRGRRLGADDYLVKPFDPDEFLAAVENKLRRTREMRRDAEDRLNDARHALVQLLSHELRTPLTYVTGGTALLSEEMERSDDLLPIEALRDNLALIESGTERLSRLADQIVTYTELQSGHAAARLREAGEVLDVVDLTASAVCVLEPDDGGDLPVDFEVTVSGDERPRVFGVNDLLITALSEVLRNAAYFSPPGSRVRVYIRRSGDHAVIEVADEGPGIRAEDLSAIWEPTVQSDRTVHEQQGLGLGLAITKGVVELHGGACSVKSEYRKGTSVTIRLPLARDGD
ncbi:MAG: HAMP domain-containing histidine kinase [Anaerolineae bacterium]|nr:HAMP domain-containing histidine kinase [Anaerolineae bacterium]